MNSSTLSSLLFTLGLLILISNAPLQSEARKSSKSGGSKFVTKVCSACLDDRATCMQVLRSDPKVSSARNMVQFAQSVLELAINKATNGQAFLRTLAATTKCPAIERCSGFDYDGVVGSFRSALRELTEDPQTASYDAKVAGDGPDTCERGLAAERVVNPAIIDLNKEIKLISKIAFAAANDLS